MGNESNWSENALCAARHKTEMLCVDADCMMSIAGRPVEMDADQMNSIAPERVLPLGLNFRDLGGYEAADGRRTKWRKVYRSGSLANLTPADQAKLAEMRIAMVCDLRSTDECNAEPCAIRDQEGLVYRNWEYAREYISVMARLRGEATSGEEARAAILQFYSELPWLFARHYRDMFALLAKGRVPLVFNCAAGKDRTGVAAALLLSVLGVAEDTVIEDYCLSDRIVDYEARVVQPRLAKQQAGAAGFSFLASLSVEARAPLLKSDAVYLRAALRAMEERCGSVRGFVQGELGVSDDALRRIHDLLLQEGDAG